MISINANSIVIFIVINLFSSSDEAGNRSMSNVRTIKSRRPPTTNTYVRQSYGYTTTYRQQSPLPKYISYDQSTPRQQQQLPSPQLQQQKPSRQQQQQQPPPSPQQQIVYVENPHQTYDQQQPQYYVAQPTPPASSANYAYVVSHQLIPQTVIQQPIASTPIFLPVVQQRLQPQSAYTNRCYINSSGFLCCSRYLESTMTSIYHQITAMPNFNRCNINKMVQIMNRELQRIFKMSFETIVGYQDFVGKTQCVNEYTCKIRIEDRYISTYASPIQYPINSDTGEDFAREPFLTQLDDVSDFNQRFTLFDDENSSDTLNDDDTFMSRLLANNYRTSDTDHQLTSFDVGPASTFFQHDHLPLNYSSSDSIF